MSTAHVTDSALIAIFTELTAVPSAIRTHYLDLTETMINSSTWGTQTSFGHMQLAAHMIAMHPGVSIPGATPALAARSMGGLAASYATGAPTDAELALTPYGRAHKQMRDGLFVGPVVGGMQI